MRVEQLLARLKEDPAVAVELYPALSKGLYLVLIRPGPADDLETMEFLTYPSDCRAILPIFTSESLPLLAELRKMSGATVVTVDGASLFRRMEKIVENGKTEIEINPGSENGIRINRPVLLGIIASI